MGYETIYNIRFYSLPPVEVMWLISTRKDTSAHVVIFCNDMYRYRCAVTHVKHKQKEGGKVVPATGHGGLYGCEMSRLPHFLDNWLTDDGCAHQQL
jgi:hypothetical protein